MTTAKIFTTKYFSFLKKIFYFKFYTSKFFTDPVWKFILCDGSRLIQIFVYPDDLPENHHYFYTDH